MTIREKRAREEGQGGTVFVLSLAHRASWSYIFSVSLVDHTVLLLFQRALFLFYYSTLQIPQRAVIGSREKCKYPRQ